MPSNKKLRTKKRNKIVEFFNPRTLKGSISLFMLVFVIAGTAILIYNSFAGGGAGALHACWIKESDKTLWCWGDNSKGQLGQGNTTNLLVPTQVKNIDNVTQVSTGGYHTCARKTDNTLWCWGDNQYGQLGLGNTVISTCGNTPCAKGPRQVREQDPTTETGDTTYLTGSSFVSAGDNHTCARKTGGGVWCWGSNSRGQLGIGRDSSGNQFGNQKLPKQLAAISNALGVYAGGYHTCATINTNTTANNPPSDTTVSCWGDNSKGQLGIGSDTTATCGTGINMGPCALFPRAVQGATTDSKLDNIRSINAGLAYTCAVKNGGALWCWGSNRYGQLGTGNTTDSKIPIRVKASSSAFIDDVLQVSSGRNHTCARKNSGSLLCWGYNASGQLGRGNRVNSSLPIGVFSNGAEGIAAGNWSTCASKTDGALWCWGNNSKGQLGIGNLIDQLLPKKLDFSWK